MKKVKIFCIIAALVVSAFSASAELSGARLQAANQLVSFLREEGFQAAIDDDDDVSFKKEGVLYWISIYDSSAPFYVELHRAGFSIGDRNRRGLVESCNHANSSIRCAKALVGQSYVSFAVESYVHSISEFRYVFYKYMNTLSGAYDSVNSYYNDNY